MAAIDDSSRAAELTMAAVKAETLIESLAWVNEYAGKTVVVKFGGNAMVDDDLARAFAEDMVYLRSVGVRPVVVHGGGPQISRELDARGITSEFRGGYRVTSDAAMGVVQQVLSEEISPRLVAMINAHGEGLAAAVAGDRIFYAERKRAAADGETVDLGRVGEIEELDRDPVLELTRDRVIPVISSIADSLSEPGAALNVNADDAAGWLAGMLRARKLVVLTDVAGLYRDWPDTSSLVEQITATELTALLPSLESGMIPKMTACLSAISAGAGAATVIDGRVPHAILLEIFTRRGSGTEIIPDERREPPEGATVNRADDALPVDDEQRRHDA